MRNKNSRATRIEGLFFSIAARMYQLRIGVFASKISFATSVDGAFSWHHSFLKRHFSTPQTK